MGWRGVLILIQVVWFILGILIDTLSILMISAPLFIPLIPMFGYDPVWLGILFFVNTQTGFLSPPLSASLYYIKGVAPKGITVWDIYLAAIPFMILQLIGLVVVTLFPPLVTWIPSLIFK